MALDASPALLGHRPRHQLGQGGGARPRGTGARGRPPRPTRCRTRAPGGRRPTRRCGGTRSSRPFARPPAAARRAGRVGLSGQMHGLVADGRRRARRAAGHAVVRLPRGRPAGGVPRHCPRRCAPGSGTRSRRAWPARCWPGWPSTSRRRTPPPVGAAAQGLAAGAAHRRVRRRAQRRLGHPAVRRPRRLLGHRAWPPPSAWTPGCWRRCWARPARRRASCWPSRGPGARPAAGHPRRGRGGGHRGRRARLRAGRGRQRAADHRHRRPGADPDAPADRGRPAGAAAGDPPLPVGHRRRVVRDGRRPQRRTGSRLGTPAARRLVGGALRRGRDGARRRRPDVPAAPERRADALPRPWHARRVGGAGPAARPHRAAAGRPRGRGAARSATRWPACAARARPWTTCGWRAAAPSTPAGDSCWPTCSAAGCESSTCRRRPAAVPRCWPPGPRGCSTEQRLLELLPAVAEPSVFPRAAEVARYDDRYATFRRTVEALRGLARSVPTRRQHWAGGALPHHEGEVGRQLPRLTGRRVGRAGQAVGDQLHRQPGDLRLVRADRRQRRCGVAPVLDVVDADDGDVLGHPDAALVQPPERTERERVVEAEDGVGRPVEAEQGVYGRCSVGAVEGGGRRHQVVVRRDAGVSQCAEVPAEAQPGGPAALVRCEPIAAIRRRPRSSRWSTAAGPRPRCRSTRGRRGRRPPARRAAPSACRPGRAVSSRGPAASGLTIRPSIMWSPKLAMASAPGRARRRSGRSAPSSRARGLPRRRAGRARRSTGCSSSGTASAITPDRPLAQVARGQVGPVVELGDGGVDLGPGVRRHVPVAVDHVGDGLHRHAGPFGDVVEPGETRCPRSAGGDVPGVRGAGSVAIAPRVVPAARSVTVTGP